ncbi:MAG: transporter substrate-binding domain-containing protein [Lachnospiraceae bacterium]|nr:transporter substrate-binding domain-containing protein [Lachnospiraceae bacterium]
MYPDKIKNIYKSIILLLTVFFSSLILISCKDKAVKDELPDKAKEYDSEEYIIGVAEGYIFEDAVRRNLPDAYVKSYESREDLYRSLTVGEIDAAADDEPIIRTIMRSESSIELIDDYIESSEYAFVFTKNEKGERLCREFGEYVSGLKDNGELNKLDEKWFGNATDNKQSESIDVLPKDGEKIRLSFDPSNIPFAYMSAGNPVGYDIDLAIGFCKEMGYSLEINRTFFPQMLDMVATGDCSMGCGAITVTEERKKRLNFSTATYHGGISLCKAADSPDFGDEGESKGGKNAFIKTFIEGERYRLFLKGILLTLLITLPAAILGTPFGTILYVFSRRGILPVRALMKALAWLCYVSPPVMMIMYAYYTYYKDLYHGGLIASVIGFMFFFASEIFKLIVRYAEKCEDGKLEYEYRLEYIDADEFFKRLLSKYGNEIREEYGEKMVMMIKLTSVVSFVSVTDITGVFDMIRMESHEVMLPLFASLTAYILIIVLISRLFKGRRR